MTALSTREGPSTESYIEREEEYENAEEAELNNAHQQYDDCDKASNKDESPEDQPFTSNNISTIQEMNTAHINIDPQTS